jgi:general secretion pathway protein J
MSHDTSQHDGERDRLPAPTRRGARGFTLMEVLVAIGVLAMLSTVMWVTINNMFETRDFVKKRYERFQLMRVAMDRITNEISAAYIAGPEFGAERKYEGDFETTSNNNTNNNPNNNSNTGGRNSGAQGGTGATESQSQSLSFREPVEFGLVGEEDELHFTSFAHARTVEGERASHHAEIGYTVDSVDRAGEDLDNALLRREDTTLDDDITDGGTTYVLIPELESIEFEYWDPGEVQFGDDQSTGQGEWVRSWDTRDREYYRRLPSRIRITVTLPPQGRRDSSETFRTQAYIMTHERLEF